jgi:hypothetical protein
MKPIADEAGKAKQCSEVCKVNHEEELEVFKISNNYYNINIYYVIKLI